MWAAKLTGATSVQIPCQNPWLLIKSFDLWTSPCVTTKKFLEQSNTANFKWSILKKGFVRQWQKLNAFVQRLTVTEHYFAHVRCAHSGNDILFLVVGDKIFLTACRKEMGGHVGTSYISKRQLLWKWKGILHKCLPFSYVITFCVTTISEESFRKISRWNNSAYKRRFHTICEKVQNH